jgi:hypothetical protein
MVNTDIANLTSGLGEAVSTARLARIVLLGRLAVCELTDARRTAPAAAT